MDISKEEQPLNKIYLSSSDDLSELNVMQICLVERPSSPVMHQVSPRYNHSSRMHPSTPTHHFKLFNNSSSSSSSILSKPVITVSPVRSEWHNQVVFRPLLSYVAGH